MVYGHANGATIEDTITVARLSAPRYRAIRLQCGVPGMASTYGVSGDKCSTSPPTPICRPRISGRRPNICASSPSCSQRRAEALGWDVHLLHDVHHRLTPIEAARRSRIWSHIGLSGSKTRLPPGIGGVPPDPPAHDDTARRRRNLQLGLGLQGADREPADRLYPRDRAPRGRHHAYAPDRLARRPAPDPHRLSRRDRPVARHDGGCAAPRARDPQFRHSGIYAPHPETDAVFPHAYRFADGMLHPGDAPGLGVDIDEGAGRRPSLCPRLSAGEPARGRDDVGW